MYIVKSKYPEYSCYASPGTVVVSLSYNSYIHITLTYINSFINLNYFVIKWLNVGNNAYESVSQTKLLSIF